MGPRRIPPAPPLTHHKILTLVGLWTAIACSAGAGIGTTAGLIEPRDGMVGFIVPIVSGLVLAIALAAGWHKAITLAARVRTAHGYIGTVAGAILIGAVAVVSSSWGIATALAGHAALRAYEARTATDQSIALDAAWTQAATEFGVILAVRDAAAKWQGLAILERKGAISGQKGSGPLAEIFAAAAERTNKLADKMQGLNDDAALVHAHALDVAQQELEAVGNDPAAFAKFANEVRTATSLLNAFQLTPLAAQGGFSKVEVTTTDSGTIKRIEASADAVTAELQARAKEISAKRRPVSVPTYIPIEARQAVRDYAGTAATGGWLVGIGMDLGPLIFVIMLLLTAREPLLLRVTNPKLIDNEPDYDGVRSPNQENELPAH